MPAGAAGGRGSGLTLPALILAAGGGSRFGAAPKLLAELDGRPLIAHVVAAALGARSVERVVVVLGAHADRVRAALPPETDTTDPSAAPSAPLHTLHCEDWAEGQSASLRCGLAAAGDAERVLVLVGDQPGVTAAAIDRLAAEPPGSRAAYGGKPGHPAVLGPELVTKAAALEGDRGLRDVVEWRLVECGDVGSGADVDTPDDLAALTSRRASRP